MESTVAQIRELAISADKPARLEIIRTLHGLAYSLEDEEDVVNRFGFLHLQTAAVVTGFDLDLFRHLTVSRKTTSLDRLVQKTKADKPLLSRLMRYLASIGAVEEVDKERYSANNVTKNLAQDVTKAGISHCFETIGRMYQAMPSFLKQTTHQNPHDDMDTVFQYAWNDSRHVFAWFDDHPEKLGYFNEYMALRRVPEESWLKMYPVAEKAAHWDQKRPVFVDVGGSIGHQCAHFKKSFPHVHGRVILQDLEHSIANALPTPGVENMVHNFFYPQPIKGARFYYLRAVLHDHPDYRVAEILRQTKHAMSPDSTILLDEMVLPETGVSTYAASIDLTMMVATAAQERTESQWCKVIEDAGLKLVKTYCYNPVSYETVLEVCLK